MMEMQNPDTGIKTQTQRVMITNIPHAVAGKSFSGVQAKNLIMEKLCVQAPWPPLGYCFMGAHWSPCSQ